MENQLFSTSADYSVSIVSPAVLGCENISKVSLVGHDGRILSVSLSRSGNKLATYGADWKIILWDLSSNTSIAEIYMRGISSPIYVNDLCLQMLFIQDRSLKVYDVGREQILWEHRCVYGNWSIDYNRIITVSEHTIQVWNAISGEYEELRKTVKPQFGESPVITHSPTDDLLAMELGNFNGILLHRSSTGESSNIELPSFPVSIMEFSCDGNRIVFGGLRKFDNYYEYGIRTYEQPSENAELLIHIWDLETNSLVAGPLKMPTAHNWSLDVLASISLSTHQTQLVYSFNRLQSSYWKHVFTSTTCVVDVESGKLLQHLPNEGFGVFLTNSAVVLM